MIGEFVQWVRTKLRRPAAARTDIARTFRRRGYPGSRGREYLVHLPEGYGPAGDPLPLVMVLHGCRKGHKTIRRHTRLNELADREQFLVVYPFITDYDGLRTRNCWGWWLDEHIHKGAGEVQDLAEILREVQRDYRVDPNHIHVAGLSSGGAMAVAMMVTHCAWIASGTTSAAVPYSETPAAVSRTRLIPPLLKPIDWIVAAMDAEMGPAKRPVPLLIIHSASDDIVKIRVAEHLRDSWGRAFGIDTAHPVFKTSGETKGTRWTHSRYGDTRGRTVVETLFVEGLGHGWYGGRDGGFAFSNAPDTARLAWDFFKAHPLHPAPALIGT